MVFKMSHSRLCPLASPTTKVTQACLNQTVLTEPGSGTTRFFIETIAPAGTGVYTIRLQLPSQITCDNCVLQWLYNTGKFISSYVCLESSQKKYIIKTSNGVKTTLQYPRIVESFHVICSRDVVRTCRC